MCLTDEESALTRVKCVDRLTIVDFGGAFLAAATATKGGSSFTTICLEIFPCLTTDHLQTMALVWVDKTMLTDDG